LAQIGGSDAHFLSAVGRCYTLFPGETAVDLRSAILARETRAGGCCYGPLTLLRYMAAQRRSHRPIVPDRSQSHHRPLEGELQVDTHADYDHDAIHMKLQGILDARTAEAAKEKVTAIADSGLHLVLDLSALIRLDSSGVTVLIAGYRSAARRGTAFMIANPSPVVDEALSTAHLNRVLSVVRSEAEARHRIQAYRETAEVLRSASRHGRIAA
jgi:anti-anti-sigma factor